MDLVHKMSKQIRLHFWSLNNNSACLCIPLWIFKNSEGIGQIAGECITIDIECKAFARKHSMCSLVERQLVSVN